MRVLLLILGIAGAGAILARAIRALLYLAQGGAEALLATDVARNRAQRGDITGLQDAASARAAAVRRRRIALAAVIFWTGLALLPLLTPWPAAMFTAYSLLWLMPNRRSLPA